MSRYNKMLIVLFLISFLPFGNLSVADDTKTNVVLILIDDLGWKDLGCYGSEYYQTPNIDLLSAEGMRFTNGYAACNVCSG